MAGEMSTVPARAARLEALDDLAEVNGNPLFHKKYAMHVVGHHLYGNDFYLGVVARNAQPLVLYRLTDGR